MPAMSKHPALHCAFLSRAFLSTAFLSMAPLCGQGDAPKPKEEPPPPYDEALREYRLALRRKPLIRRVEGRELLARSKDPRAQELLMASYAKAEAPREEVRSLLVSSVLRVFQLKEHLDPYTGWRLNNHATADAWLWFRTLGASKMNFHMDRSCTITIEEADPFLRAAAMEGMARVLEGDAGPQAEIAKSIRAALRRMPGKPIERSILLESCARMLYAERKMVRDPLRNGTWRDICETVIGSMKDRQVHPRSKLVLSRILAATFGVENLGLEPEPWLDKLQQKPTKAIAPPHCAELLGARTHGTRICFVLDASEAMLAPIDMAEKKQIQALRGSHPELPWGALRTRFDGARACVARTLATLDAKEHRFAVVLYGDEAEPLAVTRKLVGASESNVRRAADELSQVKPKGRANLHAGLVTAFRLTTGGKVKRDAYVDLRALAQGCDTIYLVSGSPPSWDDFAAPDRHGEDPVPGPFARADAPYLAEDIERENLFRKVRIHCIGIGAADRGVLERIAAPALGEVVAIGGSGDR